MKELFFGLLAIGIGTALCFAGYRLARVLIPLWGLLAGFTIGASAASDAFNNAFVGTTVGIVVGLVVGVVFALFAYFFYSLAVVLLGASLGYWLGTSMVLFFGFEKGFLSAIIGIAIGAVFALLAVVINAPKYFLIFATAVGGAVAVFGGVLLVFDKIQLDAFSYSTASAAISTSWFWSLLALVLAVVGIAYQLKTNPNYTFEQWGPSLSGGEAPKKVDSKVEDKE